MTATTPPPPSPVPDPRIISLDLETFGLFTHTPSGQPLPPQTTFQPPRMHHVDGCPPSQMAPLCSLTLPLSDPRLSSSPAPAASPSGTAPPAPAADTTWNCDRIAFLSPGPTMRLSLWEPHHLRLLTDWLRYADTIIGFNLGFDIPVLRYCFPHLRPLLRRQTLLDASVVAYLHNEMRPERSLKNLGPITRRYSYPEDTLRERAYRSALDPAARDYCGSDTHNSILCLSEFARRILTDFPSTSKLSPYCITFYSDCLWSCIRMSETGVPFHIPTLSRLHTRLLALSSLASSQCTAASLQLTGEGSQKSKAAFLSSVLTEIDSCPSEPVPPAPPGALSTCATASVPSARAAGSVLDHPLLGLTDKKKDVQFSESNRALFRSLLPSTSPSQKILHAVDIHARCQKLLSDYTFPLHLHARTARAGVHLRRDVCTPQPVLTHAHDPSVSLNHPSWYIVPSAIKDDSGGSGGTLQGRITCRHFKHQTTPPIIKRCWRSRWKSGLLVGMDLSQIELRVAALLSGDASMLRAYTANEDLHGRRALSIWGEPALLSRYPDLRSHPIDTWRKVSSRFSSREGQVGKRINFADLFRSGPDTMQSSILGDIGELFPLPMFQRIFDARPHERPGLWAWQESLLSEARRTHRLELAFTGQSRWFLPKAKHGSRTILPENEIVNFPIQTWAGNVLRRIQDRLHHLLPWDPRAPIQMFLQIYDALYFDIAGPQHLPALKQHLADAVDWVATQDAWAMLCSSVGRSVPLKYDLKIGA